MKKNLKFLVGGLVGVAVLATGFVANGSSFQAKLSPLATGTKAFALVDSALLDTDFDGVTVPTDKCSTTPAYQIVRFGPKDYTNYLGQTVKFSSVDKNLSMTFDVNGKAYGVSVGKSTYVKAVSKTYPGFSIRGLYAQYSSSGTTDEVIVVISRTDYNVATGC